MNGKEKQKQNSKFNIQALLQVCRSHQNLISYSITIGVTLRTHDYQFYYFQMKTNSYLSLHDE